MRQFPGGRYQARYTGPNGKRYTVVQGRRFASVHLADAVKA